MYRQVKKDDDIYTIAEFTQCCKDAVFTDYDGHGYWATKTGYGTSEAVKPGLLLNGTITPPVWATHVVWFNR